MNKKPNTFITSDIHLNHRNILSYCPHRASPTTDPDNILQEDIDFMNEKIISNWNSMVSPDDRVIIVGDVAMGKIDLAPAMIRQLNGKKTLVKGNHDKTLTKLIRSDRDAYGDLFDYISDGNYEETFVVNGKKYPFVFNHFPLSRWNGDDRGTMQCFGHLHGSPHDVKGRAMDIGMDTNNLFPYTVEEIVARLEKLPVMEHHHQRV